MILTCPNCGTQYVVKDGAIPPQGRQVRCASCKHSWHQDPEETAELELGPEAETGEVEHQPETEAEEAEVQPEVGADEPEGQPESFAEAAVIEPSTGPEAEERAYEEAALQGARVEELVSAGASPAASVDYDAPPGPEIQDDEFSPFAARDQGEPRRRRPVLALLLVLIAVATLVAAFWFFAPAEWKARVGLAEATTPLQLSNPPQMELRQLASGNQLLTVAGRVINPTDKAHPVPPIYAQLYDHGGKVIYRWTIAPPTPTLGPGASASFNSAEVNVPSGAEGLTISLGPPKA